MCGRVMPTFQQIVKHLIQVTAPIISFWLAGHIGQLCERTYQNLYLGTLLFLFSFTIILLAFLKLYQLIERKVFG